MRTFTILFFAATLLAAAPASAAPGDCHQEQRLRTITAYETQYVTQWVTEPVCATNAWGVWMCVAVTHAVQVPVTVPIQKTETYTVTVCE